MIEEIILSLSSAIMSAIYTLYQWGTDSFVYMLDAAVDILISVLPPASDFPQLPTPDNSPIFQKFFLTLSWFLPIQFILVCITMLSTIYFITFCLWPILRWLKVVK